MLSNSINKINIYPFNKIKYICYTGTTTRLHMTKIAVLI